MKNQTVDFVVHSIGYDLTGVPGHIPNGPSLSGIEINLKLAEPVNTVRPIVV